MNSRTTQPGPEKRPTLRVIATAAGVTHATVSMALRNHPSIPVKTRQRIRRIAEKLGYRPDPEVAKLMHHLRQKHKPRFRSIIAALTTIPKGTELPYAAAVTKGARESADALGYGFEVFRVEAGDKPSTSLQRILRSRGIEGVVLLPMHNVFPAFPVLDWTCFSTIAATGGVVTPDFHRVLPDQFGNNLTICRELAKMGYRRIGCVLDARTDRIAGHRFTAAVAWQNTLGGTETVRPFIHPADDFRGIQTWFAEEKPDVIITGDENVARLVAQQLGVRVSGRVGFATTEHHEGESVGGIDQRAEEIGRAAVVQLHARMQSGEKGVPAVPSVTMIKGEWVPAKRGRSK